MRNGFGVAPILAAGALAASASSGCGGGASSQLHCLAGDPFCGSVDYGYALVLEAQLAGLAAIRAGAGSRSVDATVRAVIDAAGHGEHFGHGLGHGVGLDIHEAPRLSPRSDTTLEVGNVVEAGLILALPEGIYPFAPKGDFRILES